MKLDNQQNIIFKQKYQGIKEVGLGQRAYRIEKNRLDKTAEFSEIFGKASLDESKIKKSEISKSRENKTSAINHASLIKSLSINHLRSNVGDVVESSSLGDLDNNGVISFNDISILVNHSRKGDLKTATELAFQGIRSSLHYS